jgi:hypothetical protein
VRDERLTQTTPDARAALPDAGAAP